MKQLTCWARRTAGKNLQAPLDWWSGGNTAAAGAEPAASQRRCGGDERERRRVRGSGIFNRAIGEPRQAIVMAPGTNNREAAGSTGAGSAMRAWRFEIRRASCADRGCNEEASARCAQARLRTRRIRDGSAQLSRAMGCPRQSSTCSMLRHDNSSTIWRLRASDVGTCAAHADGGTFTNRAGKLD